MKNSPKNIILIFLIVLVSALVLITHWPAISARAISIDDRMYFVDNHLVRNPSWESTKRFLTEVLEPSVVQGYYQPLTMISLMLDYKMIGDSDSLRPFHITSVAFHVVNTALIIIILYQLFGNIWGAAAVGLLFGVHPLTVEPIPWIGERKTLLAAFFSFLSLIAYLRYVRKGRYFAYIICALMYALSLLAKPTSTPLPVMLLLMDFWPLRRLNWKNIIEKIPLFVIAGISSVVTYISQARTASIITPETYGFMRIPFLICHDIIFYLSKMVWPVNLTSHYPFPVPFNLEHPAVLAGVVGTGVLVIVLAISLRWTKSAATGFMIFLIMVFPTMQTFQFSDAVASDKYIYLPLIGILMVTAALFAWLIDKFKDRLNFVFAAIILVLAGAEAIATRHYLADWKDSVSLYARMARISPTSIYANNNLGAALGEKGDIQGAIQCFKRILEIDPNDVDARMNLGKIMADQKNYDQAVAYYNDALLRAPHDSQVYNHIAIILIEQGRIDEAIEIYRQGLEKVTDRAVLHTGLGTLLFQKGEIDDALVQLEEAVKIKPDATALNNLGVAFTTVGKLDKAIECHKKALGLNPKNAEAYYDLGNIMIAKNMLKEAQEFYLKALNINPKYAKAHGNLGIVFAQQNNLDKAIDCFKTAMEIDPNNLGVRYNLAMALYSTGRLEDAANQYSEILKFNMNDIDTRCILADILVKQGKFEAAVSEYNQVLANDPNNAQAQQGLKNISVKQ